ncbi:MAG: ATPase, T2SS/T4P/T4SS family [Acidobacteria bacterium]|nr:ATPase, T2SS/T4P/T4SS family [Acidobacteriota bacterium]
MSLIESLIAAVLRTNGNGLVMHVGERPFVLSPSGPSNLSERPLSVEAMGNVLTDLLSVEDQRALNEVGAVEKELTIPEAPGDRFMLVAARGGDDIWIELRRQRGSTQPRRDQPAASASAAAAPPLPPAQPEAQAETIPTPRPRMAPTHSPLEPPQSTSAPREPEAVLSDPVAGRRRVTSTRDPQPGVVLPLARSPIRTDSSRLTPTPSPKYLGIGRLLRTAAARGASSLYLMAEARPKIRIDDEILPLETEPPLGTAEVESLILELAPGANREALVGGTNAEWVCELPDVGRVRCLSFRDQHGPGAVFRLIPTRLISADQLGLSRDIQALCAEGDGLILVAGPRLSGKSTLTSALVDLINRTRTDYLISLESEIKFLHENRKAIVSQREVRSDPDVMLAHARAALRENPDVLVIDDLKTPELVALALDAADSGHLVIATMTAPTTSAALARLIESAPFDRQAQVALALSESLRGAIAQVLLRKSGGGRVAAREVLFNSSSMAALIAEGKVSQLPLAIDSGRKYGMVPMNDALLAFVQSGAVDAREAYRKAHDRVAFVEQLRREGIDTSFVERLA